MKSWLEISRFKRHMHAWLVTMHIYNHSQFGFKLWDKIRCKDRFTRASPMPRAPRADAAVRSPCLVEGVYKEWKNAPAVRNVVLETDRLFQSSCHERKAIKFCIKDAVYNQYVLAPVLFRMAMVDSHPLPCLKVLARENLAFYSKYVLHFAWFIAIFIPHTDFDWGIAWHQHQGCT